MTTVLQHNVATTGGAKTSAYMKAPRAASKIHRST